MKFNIIWIIFILTFIMLIFNPFVFSQNDNTNYEIYLKSRRFTPNVGMSDSATNLLSKY